MKGLLLLLLLAVSPAAAGQKPNAAESPGALAPADPEVSGFQSAGALLEKCASSSAHGQDYCYAYLAAVSDSIRAYQIWLNLRDVCIPADITQGELKDTYRDFLVKNPSRVTDQAASIIVTALQAHFPCK